MSSTRTFSVHPSIIFSLITAQAGSLGKGMLECIMNSVDAGATFVRITMDQTKFTVVDNGKGFVDRTEIEQYFEVFGFPHEGDKLQEQRVYGQFGIGRAQLWAFARTVWRTSQFEMDVDIKNRGLDYSFKEGLEHAPGVQIDGVFHEAMSTRDVLATEQELAELAKYVQIEVTVNGKRVSAEMSKLKWTHESDDAWIRIKETGDFSVYNLGVLVKRYPGYHFGCGGEVVTKPGVRLALNMARNDVLVSQCPVWKRIKPYIQTKADETVRAKRATSGEVEASKQNLAQRAIAGELAGLYQLSEFFSSSKLITDVTGKHLSIASAVAHPSETWALASAHKERKAVKLAESHTCLVVSPQTLVRFGVDSLAELKAVLLAVQNQDFVRVSYVNISALQVFESVEDAGCTLKADYVVLPDKDRTDEEIVCLAALRAAADMARGAVGAHLHGNWGALRWRDLKVGISQTAEAWTDGERYIAFEREQLKLARTGLRGFIKLTGILVHEYLHDTGTAGSHVHDEEFYENFHDVMLGRNGTTLALIAMRKYVQETRRGRAKLVRAVLDDSDLADLTAEWEDVPGASAVTSEPESASEPYAEAARNAPAPVSARAKPAEPKARGRKVTKAVEAAPLRVVGETGDLFGNS